MENLQFTNQLKSKIRYLDINNKFSNVVILCVGTNKLIGDSIGPMVGQKLEYLLKNNENISVYGNMQETLNFKNADKVINTVCNKYQNPFIITIDAALGDKEMIEKIVVGVGKMQIGNSLGRSICYNSHVNIKGVVGGYKSNPIKNIETLMNVKEEIIDRMSDKITYGIYKSLIF